VTASLKRENSASGFTLIEMVVALALVGLVSVLMLQGIGFAAGGLDRLSHHAERLDERRSLEMLMRRALAAAEQTAVFDGEAGFVGRPTSVSFLSVIADGGPGLYRFALTYDHSRSPPAIILTRHLAGKSALPGDSASVLVRHVRGFAISYYGAPAPTDEPAWHRSWEGIAHLPRLVRIVLDDGDGAEHPPIVLRLPDDG